MACNVAKKTSLVARLRECFFGFADSAKEEHFIKLSIQERMTVLCVFSVMVCASSIKRVMSSEDWSQNPFGCILLEPNVPVPVAFLVWTLRTARWRWVDPAVFVCHAWRFAIILLWLVCDAASVPAVVQWWSSPTASVASFMCYSTLVAVVNYLVNVRFIGGLMMALVWVALAPCMAHRSLADIKSWPLVLAMVVVVLIRMFSELSTRSKYLELYYSNSEVLDYSNSTTQVKQAGCPTIKNGEAGNSTAEVKVYSISTTEVKEAVNSTTRVKDSALPPAIMPNPAATGPSSRPASQARPLGGRPSPPPPSESTSPVVLASPRVAGGPRPDSNSSPSPMPNPSPSPSPMPNPLMIVMNYLWVVFMYLPNAHQVKRFTDHIIELNLKVIRFGQVLLMAALVRMPFKYPAGRISSLGVSTSHQRHGVRAH
eukprot:gene24124-9701_t